MARVLKGVNFAQGLKDEKLIVTGAKEKREYKDGQATGQTESARVEVVGQNAGNVHVDLVPYTEDKLSRAQALFGQVITLENLVSISDAKISIYNDQLNVTVTAADIKAPGK